MGEGKKRAREREERKRERNIAGEKRIERNREKGKTKRET